MFGVREETIQAAPIVEFKYAQGAKPASGPPARRQGHHGGGADARERAVGLPVLAVPIPLGVLGGGSQEAHDWIKTVNPGRLCP